MVDAHKMVSSHLEYYLALSKDIENISRYIELCKDNYSVFSIELTRLLLTIGSEVDVVAKNLCSRYNPNKKNNRWTINDYQETLLAYLPKITEIEVDIIRHSLSFVPWESWSSKTNPEWWAGYNRVKHQRHDSYTEANLGNVLKALAGLCVLVCYLESDTIKEGLSIRKPIMFLSSKYASGGGALYSPGWKLPQ
ncbi:MAG: hypothetical protein KAS23_06100 [Anaerohalosphaera sp.]|nr:hypothetical protein [Anaerohalosphaera sp.]